MYVIFSEKADEFARIKAILGPDTTRVNSRHGLMQFLELNPTVRVLIFSPSVKPETAFGISSELRIERPLINVILVGTRIDVPTLTAALESGVKDVIEAQDATGLVNAVERCRSITERIEANEITEETGNSRGRVITIYSAKGGCGKTTIASNLAAALASRGGSTVCLIDLDLQFGDIATVLHVNPTRTISDALSFDGHLGPEDISQALVRIQDRLDLLLAPSNPIDVERISPAFVSSVVSVLQNRYEYVVIDTSPSMSEVIVRALQESDLVLLITTLDMPTIKNLRLTLSALEATDFPTTRRMIVLNQSDLRVGLAGHDVEQLIDESISLSIPSSTKVTAAANRGELIIDAYPGNGVSKAILHLAEEVERLLLQDSETRVA